MTARNFFLLTSKPTLFACNVAESDLAAIASGDANNSPRRKKRAKRSQDYARNHFATEAVVISAQIESELVDLSEEEARDYLHGLGVVGAACSALIRAVYHLLGLRTFLTTGEKETRAWTIHAATRRRPPPELFIPISSAVSSRPKPYISDDLVALGSFAKAREAGKLRIEGKDYVVADGDVIEFRFNV